MVLCLTLIASLSIAAFSTASTAQAQASCETEHDGYSYISQSGIDLDKFNLATEKEGVPPPNYHTTSQMDSAIGVSSNCTGNGSFCPGSCNAYQYVGYHYGATTIPYRIEQSAIDEPGLEALIEQAAANWNDTRIYNSSGQAVQIVNLVRNGTPVSGRPVVTVSYGGTHATWAGVHQAGSWGDMSSSAITYYSGGCNIGTVQHEFGHVLGLDDLDEDHSADTHSTIMMGYSRTTSMIQYQDIQGAALFNLAHTTHTFTRFDSNNSNREICFYCDGFRTRPSSYSSQALADESTCVHTFQQMISASDRHWHKCTKCYIVIESPFKVMGLTATTLEITGVVGTLSGSVTIPATIGGESVTSIGSSAFANQTQLSQISIPASVKTIDYSAFSGCSSLTNIDIPASVKTIGNNAFNRNISGIWHGNFKFTNGVLTEYTGNHTSYSIPNFITAIGPSAFANAVCAEISLPSSVTSIGSNAFQGCTGLTVLMQNTYPPTQNNSFNDVHAILVPHNSVDTYKASWSAVSDKIHSQMSFLYDFEYTIEPGYEDIVFVDCDAGNGTLFVTVDARHERHSFFDRYYYYADGFTISEYGNSAYIGFNLDTDGAAWFELYIEINGYVKVLDIRAQRKSHTNTYTVTFDRQDGTGGSNSVVATYGASMPSDLTAPTKVGYTFAGYYSQPNGGGALYYDENMASARPYDIIGKTTLYAKWVDAPGWTSVWSGNKSLIPDGIEGSDEGVEYFDIPGVSGLINGQIRVAGYWTDCWSGYYEDVIPFDVVCYPSAYVDLLISFESMNGPSWGFSFSLRINGDSQLSGEWGTISDYGNGFYYFTITDVWVTV